MPDTLRHAEQSLPREHPFTSEARAYLIQELGEDWLAKHRFCVSTLITEDLARKLVRWIRATESQRVI